MAVTYGIYGEFNYTLRISGASVFPCFVYSSLYFPCAWQNWQLTFTFSQGQRRKAL